MEEIIHSHSAVRECAVIGVPNAVREEDVAAFIVLHAGAELEEQELLDYCRSKMARWMVPGICRFLDRMPKTATEKPALGELAALLGQGN